MPTDRLLTYREVAAYLRLHEETVRKMVRRGELPRVRIGRHVRFHHEDVEALATAIREVAR